MACRRRHSATASAIVFPLAAFSHAMKSRSNLNPSPHSDLKKRRTFWVFRYAGVIGVSRVIGLLCQSNAVMDCPTSRLGVLHQSWILTTGLLSVACECSAPGRLAPLTIITP